MTSEIRANTLKNRVGLGTVSYTNTGIVVSGIVTANSFSGPYNGTDIVGTGITLTSTDAGSAAGPELKLFRNSASPADADYLGQLKFAGESDTGVERNYAKITGKILDASNGTEDGILEFAHIKGGSQTITGRWRSDSLQLLNGTSLTVAGDTTLTGDIDVDGHTNLDNVNISGVTTFAAAPVLPSLSGTNTNSSLPVLFRTSSGAIDGGSGLTYNPAQDVLSVNGNHISRQVFRGDGALGMFTCDNHSSTTFVNVSNTVDISTVDNATDAFTLKQGSNEYITVDTTNSSELITLGNNTTHPKIVLDGAVGIHTTTPYSPLEIQGDAGTNDARITFTRHGSPSNGTIIGHNFYRIGTDSVAGFGAYRESAMDDAYFAFHTQNTGGSFAERLRISSTGKIGMGDRSTSASNTCDPDGNQLLIRGASTFQTAKGHIMLTGDSATVGQGPQIVFSESGSGSNNAGAYIGHVRQGSNSIGDLVFGTRATSGDANTVPTERLRIRSDGEIVINHTQASTPLNNTFISIWDANSDSSAIDASGISKNYAMISLHNYGTGIQGDTTGIGFGAGSAFSYTKGSIAFQRTGSYGTGDLVFLTNNGQNTNMVNEGDERMRITKEGDIYGPGGGRKNWFDNGSFDCTYGGRKNNVSMDYGNHHAYGWVTDRFQSRNSVQWTRSTNVPTGKGFSYSTQTNGAGGQLVQAVELPDYGDMGVFTPGSYWCVSFWSTAGCNPAGAAFSYDLGNTKTDIPTVGSGGYASTGETAAGTSTGTFTRYYRVFGPIPNSIISGATAAYWQWGFTAAGYTTGFQLERVPTSTSKPTPYEHVHPSVTIARCRRYAYRVYNSRHVTGWKRHDSNINWEARHPVLPTHMPSGSNQSVDPYGVALITAGTLTNFQSVWQNPAVTSLGRYGFNPADGSFILYGTSGYSAQHTVIPSWEGFEYEIGHGFF